jgi:hypothetical protein
MKYRPVPVNWIKIGVNGRNLHIVENGMVEGLAAADADIGASRSDRGICFGNDRLGRKYRRLRIDRQALTLVRVEQREALEEGNALGRISGLASMVARGLGREAIGIDDRDAVLSLSNVPSRRPTRGSRY